MTVPTLGQLLLGTEGLALLRLAFSGDAAAREARVAEIRSLVERYEEPDLAAPLAAPEYDLDQGCGLWSQTYDQPLRLFPIEEPIVHRLLAALPVGRVLDAGCGTGRHAAWLAARGHQVVGVDGSPAMLAKAQAKLPGCRFKRGDLAALPVPDASVDAALCALALVHVADLRPALREFARVVRPGGQVVISDVHPVLVQLGWQAKFRTAEGKAGFMRLNRHLAADYAAAALDAGLQLSGLYESPLTPESAMTVAREPLPDANAAAWVGLPGVIVWHLTKPGPAPAQPRTQQRN
ncbi:class I SAM-dependent methyltransferase [Geminicoccus flavidas]|uniref:class I SAM-dependent methyltransferase n=1 Tax=Geminicoccus flavidas TaxID=2506407 RepID=UPI00135C9E07|nr:class I SAM-dependent methyltransferase [Geminicoccus flavidas]